MIDERLQVLPSGVRIVHLGQGDEGWFIEYDKILRIAAADFLRRAREPGTVEAICAELLEALARPHQGVWFVLQADYTLVGFALASIFEELGAEPCAHVSVLYLYPRRTPRSVFPALIETMRQWAAAEGATALALETKRPATRAWRRVGASLTAMTYVVPIGA